MYVNYIITLLSVLIISSNTLFKSDLKNVKQKAKEQYKKKFGKDKTPHFLGFDLTEYPGASTKYRKINQEKWNEYYECLKTQNSNSGDDLSLIPEAIEVIEATSTRFECKLCLSPLELDKSDLIKWYFAPPEIPKLTPLHYDENMLVSPVDKALEIYNIQKKHEGQYICKMHDVEAVPYFLNVVNTPDDDLMMVHPSHAPTGPYETPPEQINGTKLMLSTEWLPWTSCSKCGQVGRRHRLGYCIVKFNYVNESDTIEIHSYDYQILKIFQKIPCHSYLLPQRIKTLEEVIGRKNFIMTGYCRVECDKDVIFEVKDKNGNVIERANNSAGIYSVLQGVPQIQPTAVRLLQYGIKSEETVLHCPGNLNSDAPLQWQIGAKKIIPELIVTESKGRIFVSITDKIHLKDSRVSDSNLYSCWQHKNLAGTINLVIEEQLSLDFNHHIMLLGSILIASVFLYITFKTFTRRKLSYQALH